MNKIEHLMVIAMEECGETAQALSKAIRFGPHEIHKPIGRSNITRALDELNDLYAMFEMLKGEGIIPGSILDARKVEKKKKQVGEYMKYSMDLGTLEKPPVRKAPKEYGQTDWIQCHRCGMNIKKCKGAATKCDICGATN